jgi:hypothetical protein
MALLMSDKYSLSVKLLITVKQHFIPRYKFLSIFTTFLEIFN